MILPDDEETRKKAAEVISRGGIIAFRTDTFYGLGADPFNHSAVQRIKELKGREEHKAILIVISNRDQVNRFVDKLSVGFSLLAARFWPGPLTLIGKATVKVPAEITAGTGTIGVRLPADEKVRALVEACGGALTATSANPARETPAKTAAEVSAYFGEAVDLIIDNGKARTDQPSTVVDACDIEPKLIREGLIPWAEIQKSAKSSQPGIAPQR